MFSDIHTSIYIFGLIFCATENLFAANKYFSNKVTISVVAMATPPAGTGWTRILNTKFQDICHSADSFFGFSRPCTNVMIAWSGGVADTLRNRLIVWGGGHADYYGNEVYALDLAQKKLIRLNDPTPLSAPLSNCVTTLPDGRPTTRHTYGGLSYVAHLDKMAVLGGVASCEGGGFMSDVFTLDFTKLASDPNPGSNKYWEQIIPSLPNINYGGILGASDYDPVSKLVYLYTSRGQFYTVNLDTKSSIEIADINDPDPNGYHYSGVIDPVRRQFIILGHDQIWTLDMITNKATNTTSQWTGCSSFISADYAGLAYYPVKSKIVGWAGGSNVYLIDAATQTCKDLSDPKNSNLNLVTNAPGAQLGNGTNGRFRYFPSIKSFVLVNDPSEDAYILKIDP